MTTSDPKGAKAQTPALSAAEQALREAALEYHRSPVRGKIAVKPTKALSQPARPVARLFARRRLRVPGDRGEPALAADYTSRGNLVGVVTNGTAVLGLGDIGPLAGQAGDGGQGLPVPEVRRHRRVRHRARPSTDPRQAGRDHRRAGADARAA
jgi:hypothetical protein